MQKHSGVAWVGSRSEWALACGGGLQRVTRITLVPSIVLGVGSRSGEHSGDGDNHAVDTHVVVGGLQWCEGRSTWEVGSCKRPCTHTWALRRRVAHPRVHQLPLGNGHGAVRCAAVAAEAIDQHIRSSQNVVYSPWVSPKLLGPLRHQWLDLRSIQRLPQGQIIHNLTPHLHAPRHAEALLIPVRSGDRPPCRDAGTLEPLRLLAGGREGAKVIQHNALLCRSEGPVPDDVDGNGATGEGRASVICQIKAIGYKSQLASLHGGKTIGRHNTSLSWRCEKAHHCRSHNDQHCWPFRSHATLGSLNSTQPVDAAITTTIQRTGKKNPLLVVTSTCGSVERQPLERTKVRWTRYCICSEASWCLDDLWWWGAREPHDEPSVCVCVCLCGLLSLPPLPPAGSQPRHSWYSTPQRERRRDVTAVTGSGGGIEGGKPPRIHPANVPPELAPA